MSCPRGPDIKPILDFLTFIIISEELALLQEVIENALANDIRMLFKSMVMVSSLLDVFNDLIEGSRQSTVHVGPVTERDKLLVGYGQ